MGRGAYVVSPITRNSSLLLSGGDSGAASVQCNTTLSFVSSSIVATVLNATCASVFTPQTSDRAFSVEALAVASFIYPDRATIFSGYTSYVPVGNAIVPAAASLTCQASLSFTGRPFFKATLSIAGYTAFSAESLSIGKAFFRSNNKTQVNPIPQFHKIASFSSRGSTLFDAKPRHYVDMRVKGKSRTIMRIRSGLWPW